MSYDFADRLIEMRRTRGLSQEELAKELGLSRQAISKWERAESAPDIGNLVALSEIYEVSLDELVHGVKTDGDIDPLDGDVASNAVSQDDEAVTSENEDGSGFVEDEEEIVLKAEVLPMDEGSVESTEPTEPTEPTTAAADSFVINGKKASTSGEPAFDTAAFFEEIEQDRIAAQAAGESPSTPSAYSHAAVEDQSPESRSGQSASPSSVSSPSGSNDEPKTASSASSQASPQSATAEGAPTASAASTQGTPPPPQEGTVWVMDSAEVPVHPVEKQKNPMLTFPYPVLIVLIYLVLGFGLGLWHPAWVLFLTIPFYYWIVNVIAHDPEYLRRQGKDPE